MSVVDTPAPTPSLIQLHLRIGQPVQVILHGPQDYKHYTQLIGFVEPEYVILRTPLENGWPVPVNQGQALEVRLFSEVSLFEFSARVQAIQLHPRNFMVIDYPKTLRETRYRDHARVACRLPANIIESIAGQPTGFEVTNLSGSGAALVGPLALGEKGQVLNFELAFRLEATDTQECLQLQATVQSVEALPGDSGQPVQYRHGIRFEQADPRIFLLVHELQKKRN